MIELFFDLETNGLIQKKAGNYKDLKSYPRIVQIAWILVKDGKECSVNDYIIKPEDFTVGDYTIHGITQEMAENHGFIYKSVFNKFYIDFNLADNIICHNIQFDLPVLQSEFFRRNVELNIDKKNLICTMMNSIDFCAIPNTNKYTKHQYKYPKLNELYEKLFKKQFEHQHDASADIRATRKCYNALKKKGIIN